jgi:hypothetical protein
MVMNMQIRLILVFVIAIVMSAASDSFGAIYRYIDNNGIVCFADDLQSIPEQCRATAKIVSGEREEERKSSTQQRPETQTEAKTGNAVSSAHPEKASIASYAKSLFSGRMLISAVVVVSALFAFVILGILDADHKKAIRIVRVVILWGMSVYLILAHVGDVVSMFRTVKGEVDTVQHDSEEKGKKAAKALKEINAFTKDIDNAASQVSGGVDPEKKD